MRVSYVAFMRASSSGPAAPRAAPRSPECAVAVPGANRDPFSPANSSPGCWAIPNKCIFLRPERLPGGSPRERRGLPRSHREAQGDPRPRLWPRPLPGAHGRATQTEATGHGTEYSVLPGPAEGMGLSPTEPSELWKVCVCCQEVCKGHSSSPIISQHSPGQ